MVGIYNDTIEVIECQAQMEPFNLDQLNTIVATLEQRRQGYDIFSIADHDEVVQQADPKDIVERLQYPSTPKEFQSFNRLRDMKYEGNMLTSERRSALYWDQAKVIIEMAKFARCILFNPEMSDTYKGNIDKYTGYFSSVVRNIDIYLQKTSLCIQDVVFHWYLYPHIYPTSKELGQSSVCHIEDAANCEVKGIEREMMTIMEG